MEEEKDAFYVVKKGDIIGVYKSFSDCQSLLRSSEDNSSIRVFKGYGLAKWTEQYLASHGLKNAVYAINAADVQNDLFGKITPCPFQEVIGSTSTGPPKKLAKREPPNSSRSTSSATYAQNNHVKSEFCPVNFLVSPAHPNLSGSTSSATYPQNNHAKLEFCPVNFMVPLPCASCILEFDGAAKGNPGPAGAGAILRVADGSAVFRLREGVGIATNNVAEYRALLLGLKVALKKGFQHIRVRGDSNLVVMQIQGLWKIKSQNLADLCKEAKDLKTKFVSFEIKHVPREYNSEADTQANQALNLRDGQVEEDCSKK